MKAKREKIVYICSPLRGNIEKNIRKAQGYCREAVDLWPEVIPIAPHIYCTQFLDETIQQERETGMELGIALLDMCDELWVYGINNPSEGMKKEIAYAKEHGIPVIDAAYLYRLREKEENRQEDKTLGDALLVLPTHIGVINGVAAFESATVRISGEVVVELAAELRRNRGHDITVEAEA